MACLEIPAPKPGRPYARGLEHAEFVIGGASHPLGQAQERSEQEIVGAFVQTRPAVAFDTRALHKELNADVSLAFKGAGFPGGGGSAKFHVRPLYEVVEFEAELAHRAPES